MSATDDELAAMRAALVLGEAALGATSPNPPVGALILDAAGAVVGQGYTQPAGGDHAELVALRMAGDAARDGTAVVTLEPCNHTGATPPCVDALLAAGVRRVVYAVADPNPQAAGGAERLSEHGVEVVGDVLAADAESGALRWWLHGMHERRPFVIWKSANTLDGRVAAADGTSRWISSPSSLADAHQLRARVDAVLVGSGTVLTDDPHLTVRNAAGALADRQPLRVVLDRRGRVPDEARVLDDAADTRILRTAVPSFALKALWDEGVRSVLLEGGPTVAGAFIAAGCVDEVVLYLAPKLLGAGPVSLGDSGIGTLADAVSVDITDVTHLGPDLKIIGVPRFGPD
ncbi:MAG: bifunctional diaminohydroxyphosphoribosylaminopyrimidine deaminase/5-amino-6-(5-phosphoribosylamino)uracil reductase RibD [Jatrophihabitans sp.]